MAATITKTPHPRRTQQILLDFALVQKLKKQNPSAWYKELKVLTGTQRKEMVVRVQGVPDTPSDIANIINNKFTDITTSLPPLDVTKLPAFLPSRAPPTVLPWEVYNKLLQVKVKKSPGPDGINGVLLKEFAYELCTPIANIFNESLYEGIVPREWKEAVVVPLPKSHPPSIDQLRPVSLTSLIAKVCEGFIASWVLQDIGNNISPSQFGCLKGRSTTHCLVNLADHLFKSADRRGTSSTWVLTDFSKAFDLVDHTTAIRHLLELGVRPELVPWIASFHTDRSQKTRYQGTLSQVKHLTCGLAQGTKLGPIVFIAHVNSITDNLTAKSWAFVDDLNLIETRLAAHPPTLQGDLDNLSTWTETNRMKLNPGKCKAMQVCFVRIPPPPPVLTIGGHELEVVSIAKCLGVTFQSDLKWDMHVLEMCKKGNQRLYLLCRLRQFHLPTHDLVTVYTSFVRPVLEYATPLWHPGLTSSQRRKIENIQVRATKIILGNTFHSYSAACEALQLQKLEDRRVSLCLKFAQKLYKSEQYRHWFPRLRGEISGRETRQNKKLDQLPARTARYAKSPLPYLVQLLNSTL
ncbi:hypothetical protein Bbelb_221140 [Branchiostoma belcheri]|nr:hypothetical protein Bbelb_221140 [Branchiostoma belcheri]